MSLSRNDAHYQIDYNAPVVILVILVFLVILVILDS